MSKLVIEQLKKGILPPELDFSKKEEESIDWAKIKYNTFYKSNEFYESKFPKGFENLPAFDKIIDTMVENGKLPLQEIEERQSVLRKDN